MNEEKLNKIISKRLRIINKQTKGYVPLSISIYKLCEKENKLNYFNQIKNRIYREIEDDKKLQDYVKINPDNLKDIYLDNDGIFLFSEIFMGYFGEQFVRNLWRDINDINKRAKLDYDFENMLNNLNVNELKAFIEKCMVYVPKDKKEEAAKQLLLDKVKEELENRGFNKILKLILN